MFTRVKTAVGGGTVIYVDDVATPCIEGDTVAAVLMLEGKQPYRRTLISGQERAPFCMMGICFECLVEIDGMANQQGCLRKIEPGMRIRRQLPEGLKPQNRNDKP